MTTAALTNAQTTENFDNGQVPTGWETSGNVQVEAYSVMNGNNCVSNPGGLEVGPSVNSNGNNVVAFLSPNLGSIASNTAVTLSFDFYVFSPGQPNCSNQIMSACSATVTVYLVNSAYTGTSVPPASMIFGQFTKVVNANAMNVINTSVATQVPAGASYKLLVDATVGNCGQGTRYIIDNVSIEARQEIVTPVSFKAFTASRNKTNVSLTWTTASEQNNKGFYIQRNDGNGWKNVTFVSSLAQEGNSNSDLSYTFTDANATKGVSQYRILQMDIDGKTKFSDIRSVRGEGLALKMLVYPNPSPNGDVSVVFENESPKDVNLTDISGRLVHRFTNVINTLQIKALRSGMYTIQVSDRNSGSKLVEKLVVK
jgi:hypothetical protein